MFRYSKYNEKIQYWNTFTKDIQCHKDQESSTVWVSELPKIRINLAEDGDTLIIPEPYGVECFLYNTDNDEVVCLSVDLIELVRDIEGVIRTNLHTFKTIVPVEKFRYDSYIEMTMTENNKTYKIEIRPRHARYNIINWGEEI